MTRSKHLLAAVLIGSSLTATAQKTFECSTFKMEAEGKKICSYVQSDLNVEGYIAVREDSILYTEVKSKGTTIEKMFKYHLYIGDIEFNDMYKQLGFHDSKKGEKMLKQVSFYCAGRQQLCGRDEVFCDMNRSGAGRSAGLESYFDDGEEGRAFFADIQNRKEKLGPRQSSGTPAASSSAKKEDGLDPGHPYVYAINKTGREIYVKVDGSSTTKLFPNAKTSVSYSTNNGREFMECDKNGKKMRTLFTVSKEQAKQGEFLIQ